MNTIHNQGLYIKWQNGFTQSYNEQHVNQKRKPTSKYEVDDLIIMRNFDILNQYV